MIIVNRSDESDESMAETCDRDVSQLIAIRRIDYYGLILNRWHNRARWLSVPVIVVPRQTSNFVRHIAMVPVVWTASGEE
jgi:hypothetical protein